MLNNINKFFTKKCFLITLICILICSFGAYIIYNKIISNRIIKNKIQNQNIQTLHKPKDTTNNIVQDKSSPKGDTVKEIPLVNENIGVPVLYYHSVKETEDNEVTISPQKLRNELRYIKDSGYTTLTMTELQNYLLNNTAIPEKSIVITFDDGYMNNYTNAFSILKDLDMKATIFCITFKLDGQYYLSESAIEKMSNYGIDIQSHTAGHPDLTTMTYEQQLSEFLESKETLESITDKPVTSLAYPYGKYNDDSIRAAKDAGFTLAFTCHLGLSDRTDNPFLVDRIYISSAYDMDTFKNLLANTKK